VCFVPFVALSPHGMWASIARQLGRPLQIESLGSSVLLVAHHLFGLVLVPDWSHGSNNLVGGAAHGLALEQSVLQAAAILASGSRSRTARPTPIACCGRAPPRCARSSRSAR